MTLIIFKIAIVLVSGVFTILFIANSSTALLICRKESRGFHPNWMLIVGGFCTLLTLCFYMILVLDKFNKDINKKIGEPKYEIMNETLYKKVR